MEFPEYRDFDWRFEVQIASKSILQQVVPLVTMDLTLKKDKKDDEVEHVVLQTDPSNLQHLVKELEMALSEGRSRHTRNIIKVVK